MADWERVFTDLADGRGQALLRYAYLLTGDAAEAADLVQEAMLRAFGRTARGLTLESAEAYVRRAILTLHIDGRRRSGRWMRVRHLVTGREDVAGPEGMVVDGADLRSALAALSPRQRACVVLHYYEDLSVAQVADVLGCAPGAVKRHLSDARARLEPLLSDSREGLR
ncbi:sigma-70 family RNA polymerase sigma factor [Jiangella rhizosphaerae]|uniref:Sigma-70 family RNA polymerase sigma factor n=1 Tax=Jiangella rhizosphaerae TaxID=2293569 RepID=A0A418KJ93_9ACTN|nr:sigma-70 family RNA polymerase sigma factor [Jiangella rhizosphaerae]RIQ14432.1 sigma-70 family RNA polymerase sigma factor [Jiangella rhizosphaerae]